MKPHFMVRSYSDKDFPMIESWWAASGEMAPLPGMMPTDSSFILEIDGVPALAVALYLTNSMEIAYAENFIGNPEVKGADRIEGSKMLSDCMAAFAKAQGYKRLLCLATKEALASHYVQLGFMPTSSGVTTLVRNT